MRILPNSHDQIYTQPPTFLRRLESVTVRFESEFHVCDLRSQCRLYCKSDSAQVEFARVADERIEIRVA
jgi:hypothetical protein